VCPCCICFFISFLLSCKEGFHSAVREPVFSRNVLYGGKQKLARVGLAGWAGLGWAGLGWAGLGWAGLGWAGGLTSCTVPYQNCHESPPFLHILFCFLSFCFLFFVFVFLFLSHSSHPSQHEIIMIAFMRA